MSSKRTPRTRRVNRQAQRPLRRLLLERLEGRSLLAANLVADIGPTESSSPHEFVQSGTTTFFVANDGSSGDELWRTDGTANGTSRVKDIRPGLTGSTPQHLTDVAGTLFFTADNGLAGTELWKSDGTTDGTTLVKNVRSKSEGSEPHELTAVGNKLFFVADDGENGAELWISDGTRLGTRLVRDIVAGTGGSSPQHLTAVNGRLFFTATDAEHGVELWTSDGSEAGTTRVKDIVVGEEGSEPTNLTAVGTRLYFTATTEAGGNELWVSDGTANGTRQVRDIRSGTAGSQPTGLTNVAGMLFFHANDGIAGDGLWKSDGTASGTTLVKEIDGISDGSLAKLTAVDDRLYFRASDGDHGDELWTSDGTADGTHMVVDLRAGGDSSDPSSLVAFDGQIYFSANTVETGTELWRSDGSPEGTVLIRDIRLGASGSFPLVQAGVGDRLFFTADDGLSGRELWAFRETLGTVAFLEANSTVTEDSNGLSLDVHLTTDGDPLDSPLSVDISLVDGTATDGVDTVPFGTKTVTFPRGSTSGSTQSVTVNLVDDILIETEESLQFQLGNFVGHGFIGEQQDHHAAIADNDFATVRFVARESATDEASTGIAIAVELVTIPANAVLANDTSVTVSRSGGTTTPNADLQSFIPTTFTFPAGAGQGEQRSLTIVPLEDRLVEGDETVELRLQDAVAPLSIATAAGNHVLTVQDRNLAVAEFVNASSTAGEDDGVQLLDVKLVMTPANSRLATDVRVRVAAVGGTATNGLDYANFADAALVFPAGTIGSTIQQVALAVLSDELVEGSETVTLELTPASGPVTVDAGQQVVTIADADVAIVRFDSGTTSTGENIGEFPVAARLVMTPPTARLAAPVSFELRRVGGTALNGIDFTDFANATLTFASGAGDGDQRSIPLHPINDDLVEGPETITFEIADVAGPASLDDQAREQTVTITDGDFATVAYVSLTSSLDESGLPHGIPVQLTTTPSTATLAIDSTVDLFVTGGSATNGVDYAEFVPLRLSFDAGAGNGLTRIVRLTPTDDGEFEGDETVTFGLRNATGVVSLDAAGDTHVATIQDDEADPDVDDDGDGVPSSVESLAPNGGDGNEDGTPDAEQGDVASLPNSIDGAYITLATADGAALRNVRAVDNPAPATTPTYAAFPFGFLEFAVQVAESGSAAEVRIIPSSLVPATIYLQYGPDHVSASGHWFLLHDDGTTGASFTAEHIDLRLADGRRGDTDLTTDGLVRVLAAPGLNQALHPWQNPAAATDVNGDQFISPLDALIVINSLSSTAATQLPVPLTPPNIPPNFVDVSGDDVLSPLDALLVVNDLHVNGIRVVVGAGGAPAAEGEGSASSHIDNEVAWTPRVPPRQTASTGRAPSEAGRNEQTGATAGLSSSVYLLNDARPDKPTVAPQRENVADQENEWEDLLETLALDVSLQAN